jgi:uncharacterized surface protein with fasciclin (FAS1) repeats
MVNFLFCTLPVVLFVFTILGCRVVSGQDQSFEEIIASDPNLSVLSSVVEIARLDIGTGGDPFVQLTLFAPTDDAFERLDPTLVDNLISSGWTLHLQNVLLLHQLSDEMLSTEFSDYTSLLARNFEYIDVSVDGETDISLSTPNGPISTVTTADILSSDGVIHQVDNVLLPEFVSFGINDLVVAIDGFSILLELLETTGLISLFDMTTATVFAPTDDAFIALGDDALAYYRSNLDVATILLEGHVIAPQVVPTIDMVNGPIPYTSAGGDTFIVTIEEDSVYVINNAVIVAPDVLANNGIIHGISSVLEVPGAEFPGPTAPTTATPPTAPVGAPVKPPKVDKGMGSMESKGMGSTESKGMGSMESKGMGSTESKGMGSTESKGMGSTESKGMGSTESKGMSMSE